MIYLLVGLQLLINLLSDLVTQSHVIQTSLGNLEGTLLTARNQRTYYAYYGIPYAKAPTGNLRFEPPVKADPWNGIFDATTARAVCPQITETESNFNGIEDCLYVDVYTPRDAHAGSNFPVVFYVFGGLHKYGNTLREGTKFFMGRDIIIVRVSYRLGVLGFLSTGDTVIPGNMAMKDQTMALRWTKNNIYDFGGDPNRITIQGHSSGAACVHLLTLSPLSRDYYDQAIFQSGLATSPHLFSDRDTATSITRALAEKVNCSVESSEYLKKCLQGKEAEELVNAANKLFIWKTEPETIFRPTIEDENVKGAFLTTHPLLTPYPSNTKPWIIGMTSAEALSYINEILQNDVRLLGTKIIFPIVGIYVWTSKLNYINYIEQIASTHFLPNGNFKNVTGLVKMFTGIMHGRGILEAVQKYKGPKYIYLYDYRREADEDKYRLIGVPHSKELELLFVRATAKSLTEEDVIFSEEMITRWVNFYYTGNPNNPFPINTTVFATWDSMSSSRVEYLCINKTGTMGKDYFVNEYSWWEKIPIFSKYS